MGSRKDAGLRVGRTAPGRRRSALAPTCPRSHGPMRAHWLWLAGSHSFAVMPCTLDVCVPTLFPRGFPQQRTGNGPNPACNIASCNVPCNTEICFRFSFRALPPASSRPMFATCHATQKSASALASASFRLLPPRHSFASRKKLNVHLQRSTHMGVSVTAHIYIYI